MSKYKKQIGELLPVDKFLSIDYEENPPAIMVVKGILYKRQDDGTYSRQLACDKCGHMCVCGIDE